MNKSRIPFQYSIFLPSYHYTRHTMYSVLLFEYRVSLSLFRLQSIHTVDLATSTMYLMFSLRVHYLCSCRVYTCRPSVGQSSTPYHTICSIVLQLLDLQDIGSPQEREHRLQERFEDTELFWHLCLLNDLLGIQV